MRKKQQWINDVLSSLDGIQRAEPDGELLTQIMAKLPENPLLTVIPVWQLRWEGVAACLLLALNFYVLNVGSELTTTVSATSQTPIVINDDAMTLFSDYSLYQ